MDNSKIDIHNFQNTTTQNTQTLMSSVQLNSNLDTYQDDVKSLIMNVYNDTYLKQMNAYYLLVKEHERFTQAVQTKTRMGMSLKRTLEESQRTDQHSTNEIDVKKAEQVLCDWENALRTKQDVERHMAALSREMCNTFFSIVRMEHGLDYTIKPDLDIQNILQNQLDKTNWIQLKQKNRINVTIEEGLKQIVHHLNGSISYETLDGHSLRENQDSPSTTNGVLRVESCLSCKNNARNIIIQQKCRRITSGEIEACNCPKNPYILCSACFIIRCSTQWDLLLSQYSCDTRFVSCIISCSQCRGTICPYDAKIIETTEDQSSPILAQAQKENRLLELMIHDPHLNVAEMPNQMSTNPSSNMLSLARKLIETSKMKGLSIGGNRPNSMELSMKETTTMVTQENPERIQTMQSIFEGILSVANMYAHMQKGMDHISDMVRTIDTNVQNVSKSMEKHVDDISEVKKSLQTMEKNKLQPNSPNNNNNEIRSSKESDQNQPPQKTRKLPTERKCGNCRQVGHYYTKCPFKIDSNIAKNLFSVPVDYQQQNQNIQQYQDLTNQQDYSMNTDRQNYGSRINIPLTGIPSTNNENITLINTQQQNYHQKNYQQQPTRYTDNLGNQTAFNQQYSYHLNTQTNQQQHQHFKQQGEQENLSLSNSAEIDDPELVNLQLDQLSNETLNSTYGIPQEFLEEFRVAH